MAFELPKSIKGNPFWLMCLLEPELNEQGQLINLKVIKSFTPSARKKQEKPKEQEELVSSIDEEEVL